MLRPPRKPVSGFTASVSRATPGTPHASAKDTAWRGLASRRETEKGEKILEGKKMHKGKFKKSFGWGGILDERKPRFRLRQKPKVP